MTKIKVNVSGSRALNFVPEDHFCGLMKASLTCGWSFQAFSFPTFMKPCLEKQLVTSDPGTCSCLTVALLS